MAHVREVKDTHTQSTFEMAQRQTVHTKDIFTEYYTYTQPVCRVMIYICIKTHLYSVKCFSSCKRRCDSNFVKRWLCKVPYHDSQEGKKTAKKKSVEKWELKMEIRKKVLGD